MYKSFSTLEELFKHLEEDKQMIGVSATQYNRYPVRFVLFDNFADFNQFIVERPKGIYKQSIDAMLDRNNPDEFLSYTELSQAIREYIKMVPYNDYIFYPFSEIARFYDNSNYKEFDSIVTTIRGQQASEKAQELHTRLYIPIVGMQGKMGRFMNDNTTFIWEYKSDSDKGTYKLVITDGTTYGISGLKEKYSVVNNLYEWLRLWEEGDQVKKTILCSSPNIYANACHAQPDNAFTYVKCENAYEFLTCGLGYDFGNQTNPPEQEMVYWEQLASLIDISKFNFDCFIKERFDTFSIENGVDYIKSWFACESDFDRWLLTLFFKKISNSNDYIYRAIEHCSALSNSELFANIATLIFDESYRDNYIDIRKQAMMLAAKEGVKIPESAAHKLKEKLSSIAVSPEKGGYYSAIKLLTSLTDEELQLCVEWVARGFVRAEDIISVFPSLYHYLLPLSINSVDSSCQWISEYFDAYRYCKINNSIDLEKYQIINTINKDAASFQTWHGNFKTVKTILHNRQDIDVFYWIDGLGIDWIPFIRNIVADFSKECIYLNEIYVAAAVVPTTTAVNKVKLEELLPENGTLLKVGDIDTYAHQNKSYPQYIIDEMRLVEKSIRKVLEEYNGKKIALVSDHGLTYLSQLEEGMNLGGIKPNHEGRLATYKKTIVDDKKYIKLEDGETICALTHKSLTGKVDKGHGAHGGCTPEEVLVPIIVVSSQKNANTYNVRIENDEIDGTNPVVRFIIKGLSSIDIPSISYNDVRYQLNCKGDDVYESERLNLVDTARRISVYINDIHYITYDLKVSTGAKENDLFNF